MEIKYQNLSRTQGPTQALPSKKPKDTNPSPMATRTRTKRNSTRSNPGGETTQPNTMDQYLMHSTPKGYEYQDEEAIPDDFKLPRNQKSQHRSENESEFAESETRGSRHPSNQNEHQDQDDNEEEDPNYLPDEDNMAYIRREVERWRTPQVSRNQEEPQTTEEQLMAARTEEVQRIKMIDAMREQNAKLEEDRQRQEGINRAFETLKTNQKQQEEELQRLLKERKEIEKQVRQLEKKNQRDRKPNNDPEDPDEPSDSDSGSDDSDDESDSDPEDRNPR